MADAADSVRDAVAKNADEVTEALRPKVEAAADKVRDAAEKVRGATADVKSLGQDAGEFGALASDIASTAMEQGRNLLMNVRGQATGFADQRKDEAAQTISDLATSLRDTGKTFDDRPNIKAFVGSAADGLDQLASGIRDRSFAELYSDAETYARERPLVVAAGAVVAGFAIARFIKSSADELAAANATRSERTAEARKPASPATEI